MNEIITIIKKEFWEIIRDRSTILILLIPVFIFPILNVGLEHLNAESETKINMSLICDSSESEAMVTNFIKNDDALDVSLVSSKDPYSSLKDGDIDCCISVKNQSMNIIYNSNSFNSLLSATKINEKFREFYNSYLSENNEGIYQLNMTDENGNKSDTTETVSTMIAPIILVMLVFQNTSSFANDIFAGEKERKTIEMLLISGTKKQNIYCGKAISLIALTLVNLFVGVASYFASFKIFENGLSVLNAAYIIITLLMLSIISVFVSVTVSMRADKIKSSQMINEIFTVIPVGLTALLILGFLKDDITAFKFIPVLNVLIDYKNAFMGKVYIENIVITFLSNAALILLLIGGSVRYMKSEKIIGQ